MTAADGGLRVRKFLFLLSIFLTATPAAAAWREARTAHFIIYSEDKPAALRAFAEELERYDAGMRLLRGIPATVDSPANRLTIYAVSNVATVQRLAGGNGMIAGFYRPRAGGSVAFVPRRMGGGGRGEIDPDEILRHEYAHHFMYRNFPAAFPLWFSEGFAEFHSTARVQPDGSVDFGLPAQHRSMELFQLGSLPIETLLQPDPKKLTSMQMLLVYGRGWLLTHYLSLHPERTGQLEAYLRAINAGKTSLDAARTAFGDLKTLNSQLESYKRGRMTYLRLPASKIAIGPVEVRELSEGADAIMPVFFRSRRGVTPKEAADLVPQARRIGGRYPDDVFVQLRVAEAEFDAGNLAEADAAADRVLAKEANNLDALLYKGRVAVARLAKDKSTDEAAWKEARRWFTRANRVDPGAPEPPIEFYDSFAAANATPTPNAAAGLKAALGLAPEDSRLRFSVARQLLTEGKATEARATLAVAAFGGHAEGGSTFANLVIAAIDKGGAEEALKAWKSAEDEAKAKAEAKTSDKGKTKDKKD
jgi:tetratricopeptide (TPR) repeat protein